jgi:hypothetical protein
MLKTFRLRRFVGVVAAILGFAALGLAQTSGLPATNCLLEDEGWASANGGCQDLVSGLVWSGNVVDQEGRTLTWDWAMTWCQNKVEGGFSDWRAPTLAEAQTAFKHDIAPHLDTVDHYTTWTSTKRGNKAYVLRLNDGVVALFLQGSGMGAYCVRQP